MRPEAVDTAEFVKLAADALESGGAEELARRVGQRWTPRQICPLLHDEDANVRKLGCVTLALCGDRRAVGCLTAALRDEEPQVAELAEHALWSIWFRGGLPEARRHFRRGLAAMSDDALDAAVEHFTRAQQADTNFTEAYNQCAIAHYLAERWLDSIEQAEQAVERHRVHFGALAGLGHCHFQLGNFAEASRWYRRALAVNPRMHTVAAALARIERCVAAV
jgi:tetratricopeptide (TPR) repeat protein